MSRRQLTAAEVLERIMNLPSDDSGDESGRDSDVEDIEQQPVQEKKMKKVKKSWKPLMQDRYKEEMELAGEWLPM